MVCTTYLLMSAFWNIPDHQKVSKNVRRQMVAVKRMPWSSRPWLTGGRSESSPQVDLFLLYTHFYCLLNGSVICALHIQSYSLIRTRLSNGSQPWLYIRMIEGAFKNTDAQAMPLDDCSSLWGALSPREHLATSGDIFRYYKLLGGY